MMIYNQLGNTGKRVSAIGFGAMRFEKKLYEKDLDQCADLLIKACEMGINYIDTAPDYCDGMSEVIVGRAVSHMKEKPVISTKCGLWNATDASGARRNIEMSLQKLKVNCIDLYHMWCIKSLGEYEDMTKKDGIFDGILKAKEEGLIGHICCSTHGDGDTVAYIADDGKVDVVTLGYNALNFAYRRDGIEACYRNGLGVVVMNPLGGGAIPKYADRFEFIKTSPDQSIVEAALKFLIGHPEISVTLVGISNIDELKECVAAAKYVSPVTEERLVELTLSLTRKLNTLCTGCTYCDQCPSGVPVPKLMEAYNDYLLSGEPISIKNRLDWHWDLTPAAAEACIACGACESLCTQKLPIVQRMMEIAG
jgi:hypothetical protein